LGDFAQHYYCALFDRVICVCLGGPHTTHTPPPPPMGPKNTNPPTSPVLGGWGGTPPRPTGGRIIPRPHNVPVWFTTNHPAPVVWLFGVWGCSTARVLCVRVVAFYANEPPIHTGGPTTVSFVGPRAHLCFFFCFYLTTPPRPVVLLGLGVFTPPYFFTPTKTPPPLCGVFVFYCGVLFFWFFLFFFGFFPSL